MFNCFVIWPCFLMNYFLNIVINIFFMLQYVIWIIFCYSLFIALYFMHYFHYWFHFTHIYTVPSFVYFVFPLIYSICSKYFFYFNPCLHSKIFCHHVNISIDWITYTEFIYTENEKRNCIFFFVHHDWCILYIFLKNSTLFIVIQNGI